MAVVAVAVTVVYMLWLCWDELRSEVSKLIVQACEEFGFFKVINHGIPHDVITRMEQQGYEFFAKPESVKQQVGPANPYGYGSKNIGLKGDIGEVEYLILQTNPLSIDHKSKTIFSSK
ncbi:Gibberellin 2-beta-dioxygenase 6 [Abeliophyllum distichum]|uniref:Gibberellin 2-beta-dioxygenase 6 n=1 Tax=Abeliophyllum distichum TaxID=126358 RepID=A0ABD1TGW7_9LAMI